MNPVIELKNDLAGLATLRDWVGGSLLPVTSEHAEGRAAICVTCPNNSKEGWWNTAKDAIATEIRKQIGLKDKLKLATRYDGDIGTCSVCSCNLPLLVWTPLSLIKEHEPPERIPTYPPFCFKRIELENA